MCPLHNAIFGFLRALFGDVGRALSYVFCCFSRSLAGVLCCVLGFGTGLLDIVPRSLSERTCCKATPKMTGPANLNIFMRNLTAGIVPFLSLAIFAGSIGGDDVGMPQIPFRRDLIANPLFHFLHFGKRPSRTATRRPPHPREPRTPRPSPESERFLQLPSETWSEVPAPSMRRAAASGTACSILFPRADVSPACSAV